MFCCHVLKSWCFDAFAPVDGDLSRSSRKSRSQSLSASFRHLFHRGKRSGGGSDVSRESSMSRSEAVGTTTLRGYSTATPSPQLSTSSWTPDARHRTPEYTPRSYQAYATGGVGGGMPVLAARPSPLSHRWHCWHLLTLLCCCSSIVTGDWLKNRLAAVFINDSFVGQKFCFPLFAYWCTDLFHICAIRFVCYRGFVRKCTSLERHEELICPNILSLYKCKCPSACRLNKLT